MRSAKYAIPVVVLLALAAALHAAGCGDSVQKLDTAGTTAATKPEETVSKAQIAAAAANSPERAVLEWWRDVQVNDPEHARDLYLEPPTKANLAGQFNYVAGDLAGTVKVVSTKVEDGLTVVRLRWITPDGRPHPPTLRLQRQGGEWKLVDTRFLDEIVAQLQKAESGG